MLIVLLLLAGGVYYMYRKGVLTQGINRLSSAFDRFVQWSKK